MRIRFDPELDAAPWPGPLGSGTAAAGDAWAGPRYLLDILETALGLGGPPTPDALRAAALVPAVQATRAFWSQSAALDPLGTARRLLRWRDLLWLAGWRGEGVSARLEALASVTAGVLPGAPDRLATIAAALDRHPADVERIEVLRPADDLAPVWQAIFAALERQGTRIVLADLPPVPASPSDLHAARTRPFTPRGDTTLQLARPHGPLQAAEDVAAWLASRAAAGSGAATADTLVIGADAILDAALRRHGLPTTGSRIPPRENALLQILPLTLALGWLPPDPQRALELLTLPTSPVPRGVAWRLARRLHEHPAVDSDLWRTALAEGLTSIDETDRRDRVGARLAVLFHASVARGTPYPRAEIYRRLDVLDAWARARAHLADEPSALLFLHLAGSCAALRELVASSGLDGLSAAQLERFVDEALDRDVALEAFPAEAGLPAVRTPGAVAGPARTIVWWSFTLESVPAIATVPLAGAEIAALHDAGVAVPDPGRLAVAAAARWRRPLLQATESLLLVCPRLGADGTERHPHPLWDEIVAHAGDPAALESLTRDAPLPAPPRQARPARALPRPRRDWTAPPALIGARPAESPTSLNDLLGCSFKWVVGYHGGVGAGGTAALLETERLLGTVTHEILARLLSGAPPTPTEAEAAAHRLFDTEGPRLAAPLFLPGADALRADARQVVGHAAGELFRVLATSGLRATVVEEFMEQAALGGTVHGKPDLIVEPAAIIDLKWSGGPYRKESLRAGTAAQLAVYARLATRAGAPLPPVAFFIVRDQQLLTTTSGFFDRAQVVPGPAIDATWSALEAAVARRRAALAAGTLEAPANPDASGAVTPEEATIAAGALVLTPPCRFCDLHALCGQAFVAEPA